MKKKKKSKTIILTFILITVLMVLTFYLIQKNKKPKVYFSNDLKVEINEEVKISDFIKNVDIGEIVSEDKIIDTTKLGKQKIAIEVKYNEKIHKHLICLFDCSSAFYRLQSCCNPTVIRQYDPRGRYSG